MNVLNGFWLGIILMQSKTDFWGYYDEGKFWLGIILMQSKTINQNLKM